MTQTINTSKKKKTKEEENLPEFPQIDPSQIPKPAPAPDPNKINAKINPDKSVDYTVGNVTKHLTPEEYRALNTGLGSTLNTGGGTRTDNVQQLIALEKQAIINQQKPIVTQGDLIQPEPLESDIKPSQPDIFDVGAVVGGAVGGARLGAVAGPWGAVAGGVLGGATAFYYAVGSERKQQVKTARAKFTQSSGEMTKIINSVNAGTMSPQQASLYWDNEYARVLQTERELKELTKGAYGEKLARGMDDRAVVEAFLRRYPQFNIQFENAKLNPNPKVLYTDIPEAVDIE